MGFISLTPFAFSSAGIVYFPLLSPPFYIDAIFLPNKKLSQMVGIAQISPLGRNAWCKEINQ